MSVMGHKVGKVLLVILLCLGLSQMVLSQTGKANEARARTSISGTQYQVNNKPIISISSYLPDEPMHMMVYGLALLVLATFKRMKSTRSRNEAGISVKNSRA